MNSALREYADFHYKRGIMTAAKDMRNDLRNMADMIAYLADPTNHVAVILADVVVVFNLFDQAPGCHLLFGLTSESDHPTLKTALLAVNGLEPVLYDSIPANEAFRQEIAALARHSHFLPGLRH